MKIVKKIFKGILITILSLVGIIGIADAAWTFVPQIKADGNINGLDEYVREANDITINENAKIIGLGEATHGNIEFQELKLSVLQTLVERYDVRAFALETDFGCGIEVNKYIHGNSDISDEEANRLEFTIYQTKEMKDLIKWMHDYNENVPEEEKLSFYGFDMQSPFYSVINIADFCKANNVVDQNVIDTILVLSDGETSYHSKEANMAFEEINNINKILVNKKDEYKNCKNYDVILRATECVNMNNEYIEIGFDDYVTTSNFRDTCMAENVAWIMNYEETHNHKRIMIAGHNGHIGLNGVFYKTMGANIKDMFGEEYFTIGTDFYKTTVNASISGSNGERGNFKFVSADPFAKSAKRYNGSYYLNFNEVQNEEIKEMLNSRIPTGSAGEGLMTLNQFIPSAYRLNEAPTSIFDAMIFVYKATPTNPATE